MVFGIQAAGDVKLSNIGRALDEPVVLKKIEERLSRHLKKPKLDEQLHRIVARQATDQVKQEV